MPLPEGYSPREASATLGRDARERVLAAGLVVRSTHGRVLLAEPKTKPRWDVVGGIVEAGESVVAAARREALEEVGVELPVGDLLVVDACPATSERTEIMCFLLDGGVHDESLTGAFTYPDGEVVRAHWVEATEVVERCGPRIGPRVTAALDAFADGRLPGPPLLLVKASPNAERWSGVHDHAKVGAGGV